MERITSIADPRIAPYRDIKEGRRARGAGLYLCEGEFVVRRLFASRYPTHSVLVSDRRAERIAPLVPVGQPESPGQPGQPGIPGVPVYVASEELLHQIVGFPFHRGVLAAGERLAGPGIDAVMTAATTGTPRPLTLVICPAITDAENLGALMRVAAAFGVDAFVLGESCQDPFMRKTIRVSMGEIFRLPLVRSANLARDLLRLREHWHVQLAATVLDPSGGGEAEPLHAARRPGPPDRLALLLGEEAWGLDAQHVALCDRRLTIPMKLGTDSLNVAVAAAVFLYHFTR